MSECRFELILELDIAVRLDMAGGALALEFEQASEYYRVEVHLLLEESLRCVCLPSATSQQIGSGGESICNQPR